MNQRMWRTVFRSLILTVFALGFVVAEVMGQCGSLPAILSLGSNKNPNGLCSPVTSDVSYNITFASPLPAGPIYRLFFRWGDGSADSFVVLAPGSATYNSTQNHAFPVNSDCEYEVEIILSASGQFCTSTQQLQKITSWRTDAFNGGNVSLVSPVTNTAVHEVCEGEDISVVFNDVTNYNCNAVYDPLPSPPNGPVILPNEQMRWQQIVYNTPIGGAKIPNISVDGVPVTGAGGANIIANYQDSRGVFLMTAPVIINDGRRRPTLTITAPGGFGPGFPVVGDEFEVTIRYWNFCNPYANDFDTTPVGGDVVNGDNPPVEQTAIIRIIDSPNPPSVNNPILCESAGNGSFNITATAVGAGALTYTWYDTNPTLGPANILQGPSADNTFNPVTEGPGGLRINKNVAVSTVFNRFVTVTQGSNACTSDPQTITIRIDALNTPGSISHPMGATPNSICSGDDPVAFTSVSPGTGGGPGGTITYQWQSSTTSAVAGFGAAAGVNNGVTYNPPALVTRTWFRRRVSSGNCNDVFSNVIEFRVDTPVTGGSIGNPQTICTGGNPGVLTNTGSPTGGSGSFTYLWQQSSNIGGPYAAASGTNDGITYNPPVLANTTFYRRVVTSGVCAPGFAISNVIEVTVDQLVVPGVINNPQTICAGQDPAILGETTPPSGGDGSTYTFLWEQSATGGGAGFAAASGVNNGATYNPPVLASTTFYRRRVISGACADGFSNEIEVTVNALPTATVVGGGSACLGTPAADIVWTLTGAANYNFTITASTPEPGFPINVVGHASNTYSIVAPNPAATTTYEMTVLSDANTCVATSRGGPVTVTVQLIPPPTVESFTGQAPVCDDGGVTNPPDAILDLLPNSVQNYSITYRLRRISTGTFLPGSINFVGNSTAAGVVNLAPTYAQFGAVPSDPMGYQVVITAIQNTGTLCAGAVPINGPTLIINPRPPTPANPINGIACSTDGTGSTLAVDDPGVGNLIQWFTNPAGTIPAVGATGGTRQSQFTPTSNATQTYYAYAESQTVPTLCRSASGLAVQHTQDLNPTAAADFPDFSTCSTTESLTATPADNGGSGLWTIGSAVYYESFPSSDNGLGITGPNPHATSFTHPSNNWSLTLPSNSIFTAGTDWLIVDNGRISARDVNSNEVVWESEVINLTGSVDISADIAETGVQAGADYIRVFYKINGGPGETQFGAIDGDAAVDGAFETVSAAGVGAAGNTLQIVMRARNNGATDEHWLDNIRVSSTGSSLPIITDPSDPTSSVSNLQVGANTFTWTISSALGACAPTNDQVTITRHALPVAVDPLPQLCEDTFGSTDATVTPAYLTTLDNTVNGGNPAHTVRYYIAPTRLPADEIVANITVSSTDQVYTRVTRTDVAPQCTQDGVVTFTVNPLPVANDQVFEICEETVGSANKDDNNLPALFDNLVTGGAASRTVDWYFDPGVAVTGPADLPIGLLLTPAEEVDQDGVTDGTIYYALVTNTVTMCQNVASVEFDIQTRPTANPIVGQPNVCASNALVVYQLTNIVPGSTYSWTLPPVNPGFFEVVFGGGVNDFFVGLRFPGLTAPPASDLYTISVIETSPVASGACAGDPNVFNISVDSSPAVNPITGPRPVCKNQKGVVYQVQSPNASNTYAWSITAGDAAIVGPAAGVGRTSIVVDFGVSNSSTISVVESSPSGCSLAAAQTYIVSAADNPAMTSTSNYTLCSGDAPATAPIPLIFTAAPGGNTFTWRAINVPAAVSGVALNDSGPGNIPNTLTNVSGVDAIVTFEVTPISTAAPFCPGPKQTVFVTVKPQPIINPGQTKLICNNTAVNYSIQLTPALLPNTTTFSWAAPTMSDASVQGAAEPGIAVGPAGTLHITDVLTNATNSTITATYNVIPSNGTCAYPAVPVVITIEPSPTVSAINNATTICNGASPDIDVTSLTVPSVPANLSFDVTVSSSDPGNTGGSAFVNQLGLTAPFDIDAVDGILTNSSNADLTVTYTITPKLAGCANGTPVLVNVIVEPTPVVAAINNATTICNGASPDIDVTSLTVPSVPGDLTFDVTVSSSDLANTGGSAFADQLGLTAPFDIDAVDGILTNSSNADLTVTYTITPKLAGCADGPPVLVNVIVEPTPIVAAINNATTICNNGSPDIDVTSLTVPSVPGNLTFDVTVSSSDLVNTGGSAFADQLGLTAPFDIDAVDGVLTNSSNADITVTYTITPKLATCADGIPVLVNVIVEPIPVAAAINNATTICNNGSPDIDVTSLTVPSVPGDLTFDVTVSSSDLANTGGSAFADQLGLTAPFDIDVVDGILTNSSNADLTVTYTITPKLSGCADGTPVLVNVIVEPTPVVAAVNNAATICNGASPDIDVTSLTVPSVPGDLTFDVTVSSSDLANTGGSAFADQLGLTAPFDIDAVDGILTNSSNADLTVTYTITPKLSGCADGTPVLVNVIVEPTAVVAAVNNATTICNNGSPDIDVTSLTVPSVPGDLTFDVTVSSSDLANTGGSAFADQLGLTAPFDIDAVDGILTNSSNADITVTYTITPKLAGCADGTPVLVNVIVEPTPVVAAVNNAATICNNGSPDIDVTSLTVPSVPGDLTFDVTVSSSDLANTGGSAFADQLGLTAPFDIDAVDGILTNSSNADLTVTYTITPKLAGCADGTPVLVNVIVEPTPIVAAVNNAATICNGASPDIDVTSLTVPSVPGNLTFDVTVSSSDLANTGGSAFADQLGVSAPFDIDAVDGILTNSSNADITVTYTITPKLAGCADGTPVLVNVIVEPTPVVAAINNATTICNNGTPDIDVTSLTVPSVPGDLTFDVTVSSSDLANTGGSAFADQLGLTAPFDIDAVDGILTNSSNADITVTYTITPKLAGCANGTPVLVNVIVEPTPVVAAVNNAATICNGASPDIDVTSLSVPSVPGDLTFDVTVSSSDLANTGGSAFADQLGLTAPFDIDAVDGILTNSSDADLTVTYTITPKLAGCADGTPVLVNVIVEPTPVVAAVNNATTICNGASPNIDVTSLTVPSVPGNLTFDVTVSSSDLANTGGSAFVNQLGLTAPFDIDAVDGVLTNSSNADLTVTYTITPKLAGCANGTPVLVNVIVEPTPIVAAINNATTICNNGSPDIDVTSLTVPSVPGNLTFDVTVSSSNPGSTGGSAFVNQLGLTAPFDIDAVDGILTNSSNANLTVTYTITPKLVGCADGTPVLVNVIVEPTPVAVVGNSTSTICNSGNVNILISSPTNPTTPANLRFDLAVTSDNVGATGGSAFAPLTNQSFPILVGGTLTNSSNNFITVTYTVTPKLTGCADGPPQITTVIVEPTPTANVTNAQPRVCNGGTPDVSITTVTGVSVPANLTFDIIPSLPPGITGTGNASSGVTSVSAPFSLNTGTLSNSTNVAQTVVYTITPKLSGCINGPTQNVNVIVEPTPQVSLTNNLAKICNGGTPNVTVTSPSSPSLATDLTFDVVVGLPAGVTGTGIAGNGVLGATAPFSINAGTITNSNANFETITYTVTPKLNGCADGPPQMVSVIVEPTPVAVPTNNLPTICNGGTPDISIASPTVPSVAPNLTFDVSVSLPAGVTGTGIAGSGTTGASAPFSVNTGTLTNSTNSSKTVTYTITPRLSGCANGTPQIVNVVVEPSPVAVVVNNSPAICTGSSPSIDITSPTAPSIPGNLTFDVTVSLPPGLTGTGVASSGIIGATTPFSINTGTLTHDNLSNVNLVAVYTITPKLATCADGTPQIVNVTVRPNPVGALDNSRIVCSDEPFTYNIQTANIDALGNSVNSNFTYTVSSSDEANVPTPVGLDRVAASNAAINGTFTNLTSSDVDITYSITPFNAVGNCAGAPFDVVIRVRPEPTAPAVTTVEHCSDAANPFVFDLQTIIDTGIGGNAVPSKYTYTVSSTNPLSVFPESNRNVATTAQISHVYSNFSGVDETITYVVTPLSTAGDCQGSTFEFKIIVHPEPVGSNLNDPVCSTTLNHDIQAQITNGLNSIFTYTVSSDNGGVPAGPDRVAASNAPITDVYVNGTGSPANIVYTITPFNAANPACQGSVFTYTVNISPNPTGISDTKPAVCSDVPFSIDPQGNIVPAVASTFTWTATYDAPMTGPASGSGVIAGAIHNETNLQLFAHYTVTPTAGTCVGAPFTIELPINPEPVMEPTLAAPPAVCSSNAVSTTPIGVILQTNGVSIAADSYIVTLKSQDAGLIGAATTGTFAATTPIAGQSDAISNDTYRNTTSAQLKVVYTIVPQSVDGCMGDAFDITILVNPEPVLTSPGFPDVCSSNTGISNPVNIVLGTNGTSATAANYQLQDVQYSDGGPFGPALPASFTANPSNAVILGAPGSINIIKNDRYTNRSAVPVTVRYTIQGYSSQGCPSEFLDYEVVVNPEPVLDPALSPAPVCSDVASGVTLGVAPGSVAAATYNINNIIRQAGLVAGGSNASIGLGQGNLAIFNDTFTNTTAGPLTVTYKVVPVSADGCLGVEADVVFTVNPAPAVANNLDKTVCTNEVSGIMFATAGSSAPAANYNIVNVAIQGGLTQTAGNTGARVGVASNEIQNDQFENLGNVPLTVTYTVQGVTGATCIGPQKDIVLTVEPTITAVPVNNMLDICSGTQTDIDLTSPTLPTSGTITFNYTAVSSIGGQMTGFVPALNNLPLGYKITDNLVNNSNSVATLTYTITPVANGAKSGAGCIGAPVPVVVNVEPKPKLVASPLVQTICESDGVNISPTNILLTSATVPSVGTLEFNQISAVATGGMTLLSALKTTYLNGESITDQWDNPTLTDQTVTYTLRPEVSGGLGCPGDDVVVTVTIKPRPIISPVAPQSVCSGEFRSIPLVTDIPGTFATWTVSAPATITGALNGGGNNLDITLFNSGFNVETVTYTVTPKFNNCDGVPIDIVVTVNPTPNTVGLPATTTVCDGATLNIPLTSGVAGTTFDWVVTDVFNLEAPGFFDGSGTTINQVINNTNGFQAVLIYQVTPTSPDGCVGLPRIMNVNVGSIVANVTPDRTDICSGQRIQMTNSTLGATSHRWFYRVQGTATEIDVRTTPFVNYQLDNTTSTNPLVYEIVYQASNGLCSVPDVVTPITVYRNVVAGFDEGIVPAIIGGTSTVNFTNTSNPNDGAQFRYEWDFGSSTFATPSTFVGATPPPVVYSQQGPYQVTLKAINIAAETAGLQCESTFFKNIVVPVLPLIADFTLDPPAGCFPTTVKVIENLSTGDIMEWKVVDANGKVVAVSGLDLPEFFIATPGLFNVQLTTRDSFTDAIEFANANFEVYDIPVASFQARPTTVFVPDTEMTTFNFSTGADFYQWDFGDGETSDEREPKHTYKIEGVYDIVMVAGFDHGGGIVCTDTLTQQVVAKQGGQTKIPNAFTPNPGGPSGGVSSGGTFNDVFLPIVKGVEEFNMQIYDRWGNLIFESNSSNTGWDGYDKNGNILPAGVYVYKLTLRLSDGQRTTQIGDITMIR